MSTVGLVTEVLDLLPEFLETYFMVKIIGIVLQSNFVSFPLFHCRVTVEIVCLISWGVGLEPPCKNKVFFVIANIKHLFTFVITCVRCFLFHMKVIASELFQHAFCQSKII